MAESPSRVVRPSVADLTTEGRERLVDLLQLFGRGPGEVDEERGNASDYAPRRLFAVEWFQTDLEPH